MTYRIRIVPTDGTLTRKEGLPDPRYPFHALVERDDVVVGAEGARSEEECHDALHDAVRQARAKMKRQREARRIQAIRRLGAHGVVDGGRRRQVMTWADEEMDRMDRIEERIVAAAAKVPPFERLVEVIRAARPHQLTTEQALRLRALADARADAGGER